MEIILFVVIWTTFLSVINYSVYKKRIIKLHKKIESSKDEISSLMRIFNGTLAEFRGKIDSISMNTEFACDEIMTHLKDVHAELEVIYKDSNKGKKEKNSKTIECKVK